MDVEAGVRIYKTYIQPYRHAVETRTETSKTKAKLPKTETRTLRSISDLTLYRCDMKNIVRWIRSKQRVCNEHVLRIRNDHLVKIAKDAKLGIAKTNG